MPPAFRRFLRYFAVGSSTFGLDLALCLLLHHHFGLSTGLATAIGFLTGLSLNYALSRAWVFKGTRRQPLKGYGLFLLLALVLATLTAGLTQLLLLLAPLSLATTRLLIAGPVGALNYWLNLRITFKVRGKPL